MSLRGALGTKQSKFKNYFKESWNTGEPEISRNLIIGLEYAELTEKIIGAANEVNFLVSWFPNKKKRKG
jgi:hypothetical protein